jgi:hypothetical protein
VDLITAETLSPTFNHAALGDHTFDQVFSNLHDDVSHYAAN